MVLVLVLMWEWRRHSTSRVNAGVAEIRLEKQGSKMIGKKVRTVCNDAVKEETRMTRA